MAIREYDYDAKEAKRTAAKRRFVIWPRKLYEPNISWHDKPVRMVYWQWVLKRGKPDFSLGYQISVGEVGDQCHWYDACRLGFDIDEY